MIAFDFVYGLYVNIEELVKSSDYYSLDPLTREISQVIYRRVESLLEISKRCHETGIDGEIYMECRRLERVVDRQIKQGVEFSMEEVENLKQKIHSFTLHLNQLADESVDALYNNCFPDKDHPGAAMSSSDIIGVADVYYQLIDNLMSSDQVLVTSLVGMPGIGKTALANKAFRASNIAERFGRRVWVRLGKGCRFEDIPRRILVEMDPDAGDRDHEKKLKERLESERCLVVLDNVWNPYMAYHLDPSNRRNKYHPFVGSDSGSRILVISRLQQLGQNRKPLGQDHPRVLITMRLMDEDESWELLHHNTFGKGNPCPPQLEKAGKKIAEKCEGLLLTIVAVAALLSEHHKTLEFWNEVAARENHGLFLDAYHQISKVLLPSYTFLPRVLQICFHFIGLFRRNYEIPRERLFNLWHVDGFEEINPVILQIHFNPNKLLEELVLNSLVIAYKESAYNYDHTVKTCGLHSSLWHLSNKVAKETKFSIILNSLDDGLDDAIEGHRRLSFHNNVLFGIKDVIESVEDKCASTARSLLCFGPYHQYQVPICCRLGLLRELDVVSIRFYEFPTEVLQLTLLKSLALTLNGIIPPSISQLSKLQFLIVERHANIKSVNGPSHLPVEIWNLEKLRHLQVMGSDLPDPGSASLKKLSKLLDVGVNSCTEAVLKAVPNLYELRIRVGLAADDGGDPLSCFALTSHHLQLRYVKCVILNPGVARPTMPFSSFGSVEKLSLSGLGYPWKKMSKIGSMESLKVLKLKNYAFRGAEWEVEEGFDNSEEQSGK